jgi:hypothetical protein
MLERNIILSVVKWFHKINMGNDPATPQPHLLQECTIEPWDSK